MARSSGLVRLSARLAPLSSGRGAFLSLSFAFSSCACGLSPPSCENPGADASIKVNNNAAVNVAKIFIRSLRVECVLHNFGPATSDVKAVARDGPQCDDARKGNRV